VDQDKDIAERRPLPSGVFGIPTGNVSVDVARRRRFLEETEKEFIEGDPRNPGEEPKGILQGQKTVPGTMGGKTIVKPGQTFVFGGIQYKVAGDRSFHRITEKKPSRKAWRRKQVMERKAERERKRRVKGW